MEALLGQETEKKLLGAFMKHAVPVFIDIGAERGAFSSWFESEGYEGYLFEPLPQHAAGLRRLTEAKKVTHFPWAIDAEDGERTFHIATDEKGEPLDHFHSLQPLADDPNVKHRKSLAVVCRSLGSLVAEGTLPPNVGLVKVDTEGNDLRVMTGFGSLQCQILMVEYFTAGLYNGWEDANPDKLCAKAKRMGFTHCIAVRRRRNEPERVTYQPLSFLNEEWGNLIFIRDDVFSACERPVADLVAESERCLMEKLSFLQQTCDERLALIQSLHGACEALQSTRESKN